MGEPWNVSGGSAASPNTACCLKKLISLTNTPKKIRRAHRTPEISSCSYYICPLVRGSVEVDIVVREEGELCALGGDLAYEVVLVLFGFEDVDVGRAAALRDAGAVGIGAGA